MAFVLAGALGGTIPIWLISWLVGKAPPLRTLGRSRNILYSGLVAYVVMVAVVGFGEADGGPWNPGPWWIIYLVSLLTVVTLRITFAAVRERRSVED